MATNIARIATIDELERQPDPAKLARNCVMTGVFIGASVVYHVLSALPHPVTTIYLQYALDLVLIVTFVFGIFLIVTGWLVASDPPRYNAFARNMLRASHVVLVLAIALAESKH